MPAAVYEHSESVSVVIPYGSELPLLRRQLQRLSAQTCIAPFEVLISCNIAPVDIESLDVSADVPFTLRILDATDKRGPSHARNVGWQNATGAVVLFCDADDEVSCDWIYRMVLALHSYDLVGGRLRYEKINPPYLASWHNRLQDKPSRKFGHLGFVPSCNLGLRKDVLVSLGGFDEELTHGEDIDLCWRAQYKGNQLGFEPAAVVDYRLRADHRSLWTQYFKYGMSDSVLLVRHKPYGAQKRLMETVTDLLSVGLTVLRWPTGRASRLKTTARLANLSGRIYGSIISRVWAI